MTGVFRVKGCQGTKFFYVFLFFLHASCAQSRPEACCSMHVSVTPGTGLIESPSKQGELGRIEVLTPEKPPGGQKRRAPPPDSESWQPTAKIARRTADWLTLGRQQCASANLSFNQDFQQAHWANQCAMPSGHWQAFLKDLGADKEILRCKACLQLQKQVARAALDVPEQPEQPASVDADMAAADDGSVRATPRDRKGRPFACEPPFSLQAWLAQNRPGIYKLHQGGKYPAFCAPCNKQILLQRNSFRFVLVHEQTAQHRAAVAASGLDPHNASTGQSTEQVCGGIPVDGGASPLSQISESVYNWYHSGCLRFANFSGERSPLQDALWQMVDSQLTLRSAGCSGTGASQCRQCLALANSQALRREVAKWSFRIDLFEYGKTLLYSGGPEQQRVREQILSRDYRQTGQAGVEAAQLFAAPAP